MKQYVVVVPPGLWPTVVTAADRYGLRLVLTDRGRPESPAYVPVLASRIDLAAQATSTAQQPRPPVRLTPMQLKVLRGLATPMTVPELAKVMYLSVNTVRLHVRRTFRKLDVHTRAAAVAEGYRLGLLDNTQTGGGAR